MLFLYRLLPSPTYSYQEMAFSNFSNSYMLAVLLWTDYFHYVLILQFSVYVSIIIFVILLKWKRKYEKLNDLQRQFNWMRKVCDVRSWIRSPVFLCRSGYQEICCMQQQPLFYKLASKVMQFDLEFLHGTKIHPSFCIHKNSFTDYTTPRLF